jgi:hypothetical protein
MLLRLFICYCQWTDLHSFFSAIFFFLIFYLHRWLSIHHWIIRMTHINYFMTHSNYLWSLSSHWTHPLYMQLSSLFPLPWSSLCFLRREKKKVFSYPTLSYLVFSYPTFPSFILLFPTSFLLGHFCLRIWFFLCEAQGKKKQENQFWVVTQKR